MEINVEFIKENFYINNKIGKGNFGNIYKVKDIKNNTDWSIKRLFLNKEYNNRELGILLELDNEFCIKLIYFCKIPIDKYINFINFYKEKSDFYDYESNELINLNKEKIDEVLFIFTDYFNSNLNQFIKSPIFWDNQIFYSKIIFKSVINGLVYIKNKDILHRDIKADNILIKIDNDKNIKVVICDFGSAKKMPDKGETGISYICSRPYRAPELLLGLKNYNFKIDVWSAGCLFYKVIKGVNIFFEKDTKKMLRSITNVLGPPQKKDIEGMGDKRNIKINFDYKIETLEEKLIEFPKEIVQIIIKIIRWNPLEREELKNILLLINDIK